MSARCIAHCRYPLRAVLAWLWLVAVPAQAQPAVEPWSVESIVTRRLADGTPATTTLAVRVPADQPVKHVVLYPSPNGRPFLKASSGPLALNLIGPWVRASEQLNQRGIAVVFADAPSDAQGLDIARRTPADVRRDLQAVVVHLQKSFAGTPVHLGLFGSATMPVLDVAAHL